MDFKYIFLHKVETDMSDFQLDVVGIQVRRLEPRTRWKWNKYEGVNVRRLARVGAKQVKWVINVFTVPRGSQGVLFIGYLGGQFTLSKQPQTASRIMLSIRSQGHYSHSGFTIIFVPS
jgi:hypothetical protein